MVAESDKKILVVDDEVSVLALLKEIFSTAGYKVYEPQEMRKGR